MNVKSPGAGEGGPGGWVRVGRGAEGGWGKNEQRLSQTVSVKSTALVRVFQRALPTSYGLAF